MTQKKPLEKKSILSLSLELPSSRKLRKSRVKLGINFISMPQSYSANTSIMMRFAAFFYPFRLGYISSHFKLVGFKL